MPNYTPTQYKNNLADIKSVFESLEKDFNVLQPGDEGTSNSSAYAENEEALIILQNDLMSDMDTNLKAIDRENITITEYDTNNEILNTRYIDIKDKIYGAIGMKNDTQTLYNHEYYGNLLIFSSILGGCLLYARTRNL
jgi:hypothetical protein|tara:strand:+ start:45 stop:458 length:414 start_codon:yes stop_codon:yes gene_type:complete